MLFNAGALADPSLPSIWALGGLWLLTVGSVGLWLRRLSGRLSALNRLSTLDPLTGLGSERMFESERWPAAVRAPLPLAVLHIDLDHLQQNKDGHGQATGDQSIVQAASVLRGGCRRGVDEVFRFHTAGDAFVVLVRGPEALRADTIAQNLVGRLRAHGISASVGAAWTASGNHRERTKLLDAAEAALNQAKAAGLGCAVTISLPIETHDESNEAVPEPIVEEWTDAKRSIAPRDRVAVLLYQVRDDARLAFPSHRISLSIAERLPLLTADEGRFLLATATLLLHVAAISRHAHITARIGPRAGLFPESADGEALMLRVCVEFHVEGTASNPSLLDVCKRVCVQEGGAWTAQANCVCLAWPVTQGARPIQPALRLIADKPAALVSRTGGAS